MQWETGPTAGFSDAGVASLYAPVIDDKVYSPARVNVASQRADPNSLLNVVRRMISIRKQHRAFGWGEFKLSDFGNKAIAAFQRTHYNETILAIHNLSESNQKISHPMKKPVTSMTDLLTHQEFFPVKEDLKIELMPYQYLWLKE